jgi:CheY-like chemotaxis protein
MPNRPDKSKSGQAKSVASGPQSPPSSDRRHNSLGLSPQELASVHGQLDSAGGSDANHKRLSARLSFHHDNIGVEIVQPGGARSAFNVACRNLSRSGLGFLHSSYLHMGTIVYTSLVRDDGSVVRVAGKIVRCRHVARHIHEIGVRFDRPVDVRNFVAADVTNRTFTTELVNPAQLKGTALVVAEYQIEQDCVRQMLRGTSLDFVGASSVAEALARACKGVHIILCDDTFRDGTGVELVAKARQSGVRCPIILMSADGSEASLQRIRGADADAFLPKPIEQDQLLRALAEFLLHGTEGMGNVGLIHSSLPADSPLNVQVDAFLRDLHSLTDDIEKFVADHDAPGVRAKCLRIGGTATYLGFAPITELAGAVVRAIDNSGGLDGAVVELATFLASCRNTRKAVGPARAA